MAQNLYETEKQRSTPTHLHERRVFISFLLRSLLRTINFFVLLLYIQREGAHTNVVEFMVSPL